MIKIFLRVLFFLCLTIFYGTQFTQFLHLIYIFYAMYRIMRSGEKGRIFFGCNSKLKLQQNQLHHHAICSISFTFINRRYLLYIVLYNLKLKRFSRFIFNGKSAIYAMNHVTQRWVSTRTDMDLVEKMLLHNYTRRCSSKLFFFLKFRFF